MFFLHHGAIGTLLYFMSSAVGTKFEKFDKMTSYSALFAIMKQRILEIKIAKVNRILERKSKLNCQSNRPKYLYVVHRLLNQTRLDKFKIFAFQKSTNSVNEYHNFPS